MSSFTTPLDVRILAEKEEGRTLSSVLAPFVYYTDIFGDRFYITVDAGFKTDFASIPRAFWGFYPPFGEYAKAAVVHDYLCKNRHIMSSKDAHKVFKEAMLVLGVSKRDAAIMYNAVRLFGPRFEKQKAPL
jgi:hypothetical protein